MSEQGKAQVHLVGAGLVGFAIVVGVGGALLVLPHGGAPARSSASAVVSAPSRSALAVPAPAATSASAGVPMGEASASAASPAPILPEAARDAAPAPAQAPSAVSAASAVAPASSFGKLVVSQHLESGASAHSSAAASTGASAFKVDKPAKKPFVAPKLDLSKTQSAVASSVHYGVTGRSELMGRAAGPVYNFSGKNLGAGQSGQVAVGAMAGQVDAAQAQVDALPLNDHDKAVLGAQLEQAKKVVTATAPSN